MTNNPTATKTSLTTSGRLARGVLALATAGVLATSAGQTSAQPAGPPDRHTMIEILEEVCERFNHPVSADLGAVLPSNYEVRGRMIEILHGRVHAGTDCSVFEHVV